MTTTQDSNAVGGFRRDLNTAGAGISAVKSDVAHLAHDAVDAARSGVAEVRDGAKHAMASAKAAGTETMHSVSGLVARNPFTTIGIAIGVGLLSGMLLSRSRS